MAGETLFSEGDYADKAYLIQEGIVEISKPNEQKQDVILAKIGRGEMIGEMALIESNHRTATARAVGDVTVIVVERAEFDMRMERSDPVVRQLLRIFVNRLKQTTNRKMDESSEPRW